MIGRSHLRRGGEPPPTLGTEWAFPWASPPSCSAGSTLPRTLQLSITLASISTQGLSSLGRFHHRRATGGTENVFRKQTCYAGERMKGHANLPRAPPLTR